MKKVLTLLIPTYTPLSRIEAKLGEELDYVAGWEIPDYFKGRSLFLFPTSNTLKILKNEEALETHPHFYIGIRAESSIFREIIETPDIVIKDSPERYHSDNDVIDAEALKKILTLQRQINYYYDLPEKERREYVRLVCKKLNIC